MNKKEKVAVILILIAFVLSLFFLSLPAKSEDVNKQVVLQVVSNGSEEKLVVPKQTVILRLTPISGDTAKAPLAKGDLIVCQPSGFKDQNGIDHAGFKCGNDLYAIAGIRYQ